MINFDDVTKENIKKNIIQIDHKFLIIQNAITGDSGSGKTNSLFNLISHQQSIDKIYWDAKDPYEGK